MHARLHTFFQPFIQCKTDLNFYFVIVQDTYRIFRDWRNRSIISRKFSLYVCIFHLFTKFFFASDYENLEWN